MLLTSSKIFCATLLMLISTTSSHLLEGRYMKLFVVADKFNKMKSNISPVEVGIEIFDNFSFVIRNLLHLS